MIDPHDEKVAAVLKEIRQIKWGLYGCYKFESETYEKLAAVLRNADSRGILIDEVLELTDVTYWLQQLDYHGKWLRLMLGFADAPSRKSLKPLIEFYGADRTRVKAEVEILEKQLQRALSRTRDWGDEEVRRQIRDNRQRVLAAHLRFRSGCTGVRIAEIFNVPRGTAYGWLDWFRKLPLDLQNGILESIDAQVARFIAGQSPGGAVSQQEKQPA